MIGERYIYHEWFFNLWIASPGGKACGHGRSSRLNLLRQQLPTAKTSSEICEMKINLSPWIQ